MQCTYITKNNIILRITKITNLHTNLRCGEIYLCIQIKYIKCQANWTIGKKYYYIVMLTRYLIDYFELQLNSHQSFVNYENGKYKFIQIRMFQAAGCCYWMLCIECASNGSSVHIIQLCYLCESTQASALAITIATMLSTGTFTYIIEQPITTQTALSVHT